MNQKLIKGPIGPSHRQPKRSERIQATSEIMFLEISREPETLVGRKLSVVRDGRGWAVKHGEGYLGHARRLEEALMLVQALQSSALPPSRRLPAHPFIGQSRP
jgi:hypothetical protein